MTDMCHDIVIVGYPLTMVMVIIGVIVCVIITPNLMVDNG